MSHEGGLYVSGIPHLIRRFAESISSGRIAEQDDFWVSGVLTRVELDLWSKMQTMDRQHSIGVARRLVEMTPDVDRIEIAAALLHDVGKCRSSLGVGGRVLATVMGPRTRRLRAYHDHESIGAEMCRARGVDPRICDLIVGIGETDAVRRLSRADDL